LKQNTFTGFREIFGLCTGPLPPAEFAFYDRQDCVYSQARVGFIGAQSQ
jgi:hypothetical protein